MQGSVATCSTEPVVMRVKLMASPRPDTFECGLGGQSKETQPKSGLESKPPFEAGRPLVGEVRKAAG